MSSSLRIQIAGVTFAVTPADRQAAIAPPRDLAYQHFMLPATPAPVDIQVLISSGPTQHAGLADLPRLFDGGGAWSLFASDGGYLITLNPNPEEPPLWTISANRQFTRLTATCRTSMVTRDNGRPSLPCPITYPLDQIILIHHLAHRKGVVAHCAGLDCQGRGIIFPGPSGAGKSSVSRILLADDRAALLSDDRMVVRQENERYVIYGTPWAGDAKIAANRRSRLDAIYFLTRAAFNRATPLTPSEALKRLLPVTSIPWYDRVAMPRTLDFCGELLKQVPAFDLRFTLDQNLMDVLVGFFPETETGR